MLSRRKEMKYKQIVFDVDGTLIDTEHAVLHSLQETIRTVTGNTIELRKLTFALGITGEDALEKLNITDVPFTLALWDRNMKKYSDTVCIFAGIIEVLDNLAQSGYQSGIVTSKTKVEFEHDFNRFGINKYFGTIICADDTAEHKPSPAPLLKYMRISKTNNQELLYIGDSAYDMKCAKNANIDFALAGWGAFSREIKADYCLEKPSDLLSIIIPNK